MNNYPPPGWRPMWELPAPGKKRRFVFKKEDEEQFREHLAPQLNITVLDFGVDPPMSSLLTIAPIGWRYV